VQLYPEVAFYRAPSIRERDCRPFRKTGDKNGGMRYMEMNGTSSTKAGVFYHRAHAEAPSDRMAEEKRIITLEPIDVCCTKHNVEATPVVRSAGTSFRDLRQWNLPLL